MIKNECEIVKDLMPSYIEDLASQGTKEFVEEHIKTCESCEETLENLKKEREQEKQKEEQKGKFEINHLKKYNKVLETLKTIIFIIAVILGIICLTILGNVVIDKIELYKRGKRGEEIGRMIEEAIFNTEKVIQEDNFKLALTRGGKNTGYDQSSFIYQSSQDKFFTKESSQGIVQNKRYLFKDGEKLKGIVKYATGETNLYESEISTFGIEYWGAFTKISNDYIRADIKIREEKNGDKDAYVLSRTEGECYYELWIDKENNLIIRYIESIRGVLHTDNNYTWELREISNEEIFEGETVKEIQNQYNELKQSTEEIQKIISESNTKVKEFIKGINYRLTRESNLGKDKRVKQIYQVKNQKIIMQDTSNAPNSLVYGYIEESDIEGTCIEGVYIDEGKIRTSKVKQQLINNLGILSYENMNIGMVSRVKLKEEKYNNRDCYVLEFFNKKTWIDKESKLPVKEIEETSDNKFNEQYHTWIAEPVTNIDEYTWEKDSIEGELFDDEMLKKVKEMYNKI